MKRMVLDNKGFTLAELLIASLFGVIVMATLYGFFRDQLFNLLQQETKTGTLEEVRGAMDMMVRELRNAGSWGKSPYTAPTNCSRVATATSEKIQIRADLDADGDCAGATGEDVTYELSGSKITRNDDSLVESVVLPSGSSFLTYYKADNTSFTPSTAADRDLIKRVKITFGVQVQNPNPNSRAANPNITSTLSTSVEFRN